MMVRACVPIQAPTAATSLAAAAAKKLHQQEVPSLHRLEFRRSTPPFGFPILLLLFTPSLVGAFSRFEMCLADGFFFLSPFTDDFISLVVSSSSSSFETVLSFLDVPLPRLLAEWDSVRSV